jgi:hypothetical protein
MAEKKETQKADKPVAEKKSAEKKADCKQAEKTKPDIELKETEKGTEKEKEESYLKDIMSIGGHGGLFRFISQGRNGIIVESLETGKRMQAFATMKVSALKDIAIFTEEEEIQLDEVFIRIHKYENGSEAISPKSDPDELKDYFSAILPEYDRERVYVSDIKRVLGWYNFLLSKDLLKVDKPKKVAEEKKTEKDKTETDKKPAG